jgi:hypothetical protein
MFLSVSANLLLNWIIIPAAALLLGILPFLWSSAPRERVVVAD